MEPTTPRRTPKDHCFISQSRKSLLQNFEAIPLDPPNLSRNAIDLRIMLCTLDLLRILFDREDAVPAARGRESDCIATNTTKRINQNGF